MQFLQRAGADLPTELVEHLDKTRAAPTPPAHRRILKRRRENIRNILDIGRPGNISPEAICRELKHYSRLSLSPKRRLPENLAILRALPVELLTQLDILVLAFQESGVYDIHRARCTATRFFRNQTSVIDRVWTQAGWENMYGVLCGSLPARLIALFKSCQAMCSRIWSIASPVQLMNLVDS